MSLLSLLNWFTKFLFITDTDNLKEIVDALKQVLFPNHKWFPLGLQLGLLSPTLKDIEANHKDDVRRCLQECLTLWLSKADKVTDNGGSTWDSLADALRNIEENFAAEKIMEFSEKFNDRYVRTVHLLFSSFLIEFSTPACQMLQKHTDRFSPLTLPVEIVNMLYTERVISKETLDEVNRLGGVLGDGPLRALCTTVCEEPNKLKIFASILLKSEQTVVIAKDILKEYGN